MNPRHSPRLPVQAFATFSTDGGIETGQVQDLSVPGCRLESMAALQVGQTVNLHLTFKPTHAPLRIPLAVIRWVESPWAGLEFIGMSIADQARLRRLVGYRNWWPLSQYRAQAS